MQDEAGGRKMTVGDAMQSSLGSKTFENLYHERLNRRNGYYFSSLLILIKMHTQKVSYKLSI